MRRCLLLLVYLFLYTYGCSAVHEKNVVSIPPPPPAVVNEGETNQPIERHTLVDPLLVVSIDDQRMYVYSHSKLIKSYLISTSRFGIGFTNGSYKTPLGWHRIYKKIGEGEPLGKVFKGREAVDYVAPIERKESSCPCDRFMTTRILWLDGLEAGKNAGGAVDTRERFIYIHGTNLEWEIGRPASFGCIYMKNDEVAELFDLVPEGTIVHIQKESIMGEKVRYTKKRTYEGSDHH